MSHSWRSHLLLFREYIIFLTKCSHVSPRSWPPATTCSHSGSSAVAGPVSASLSSPNIWLRLIRPIRWRHSSASFVYRQTQTSSQSDSRSITANGPFALEGLSKSTHCYSVAGKNGLCLVHFRTLERTWPRTHTTDSSLESLKDRPL